MTPSPGLFSVQILRFPGDIALGSTRHGWRRALAAASVLALAVGLNGNSFAQTQAPIGPTGPAAKGEEGLTQIPPSVLNAELMYLVLTGEMQLQAGQPGAAYSMILEAARRSEHPDLYRRAVNIALRSGSADAAMAAARAWSLAEKSSPEPLRVMLQIQLSTNLVAPSGNTLDQLLDATPELERNDLIDLVGQLYARARDKASALRVISSSMRLWQRNSATASGAWAALGRVQLAAGLKEEAERSVEMAMKAQPAVSSAGLLAIELLIDANPSRQHALEQWLDDNPDLSTVRLAYAQYLINSRHYDKASQQLRWLVNREPELAEPWLLQGLLGVQRRDWTDAETSLQRFLTLTSGWSPERRIKGEAQAYLALAQMAELRRQPQEARAWLDKINPSETNLNAQLARARLAAKEGRMDEGRQLIRNAPERQAGDARAKLLTEASLLKEFKQYQVAIEVLDQALTLNSKDVDVLHEQAGLLEKLGHFDRMETLLRQVIQLEPQNPQAYNFLGYSLADRNLRLTEAKVLIQKALSYAPNDPFITDSLGWVEYRLGNLAEAERLLRAAMAARPDAEIATHLGEVLWMSGRPESARALFKEAQALQPDNETLQSTLKRLNITIP